MSSPSVLASSGEVINGIPVALIPLLLQGTEPFYQFRTACYLSVASLTFLIYDHLLTLQDEVEYIWKAPPNITKYLFLINRYLVPTAIAISMRAFTGIQQDTLSNDFCKIWTAISFAISPLAVANGSFIVLLRLWNLWDRRANLVLTTLGIFIATELVTFAMAIRIAVRAYDEIQYFPLTHSCVFPAKINLVSIYAPGVGFEIIVFGLTWWNALSRPRTSDKAMASQLYRDGTVVFFLVFTLRILNMSLAAIAPLGLTFLGLFFVWAGTTMIISHLVINLRRAAEQQASKRAAMEDGEGEDAEAVRMYHTPTSSRSVRSQELPALQSGWGASHEGELGEGYELGSKT